ncbi:MAG: hypothetical protein OEL86_06450 [Sulfuritalea sp.]|nr:hypothetical protein [Sulfuritalea sp.]
MKIKLEEYIREDGASPYKAWFDGLDAQAAAKVTVAKTRHQAVALHDEYKARKKTLATARKGKKS